MDPTTALLFLSGAALGVVTCLAAFRKRSRALGRELTNVQSEKLVTEERLRLVELQRAEFGKELDQARGEILRLTSSHAEVQAVARALQDRNQDQQHLLGELQSRFSEGFENIARRILVESSNAIDTSHRTALQDILSPLRETVERFNQQVEVTHREAVRENQSLKDQLDRLQTLNRTIGDEAKNLTTALRGQSKTRGTWGEMILERVLEQSGLVRGREFLVQEQHVGQEGRRLQPDVIIVMPENRQVVIDAKVSLIAYERYCNSESDVERSAALADHVDSVRRHIRDLSGKEYDRVEALQSPEFVLMFVPIEPAFNDAVNADPDLCSEAIARNVVLVSASSLLATLRIIASLWRVERQNRNALEIARRAGELYDKFVGFVNDLEEVGRKLEGARLAHDASLMKLSQGKGNLVRRIEDLKNLGARTSKSLNPDTVENAGKDPGTSLEGS